jgi:putative hemolysin
MMPVSVMPVSVLAAAAGDGSDDFTFGTTQILMVVAVLLLVVIAGFLAMSETALTRMTKIKAGAMADEGRRGAKTLVRLMDRPEQFLSPVLLLVLMSHLIISTLVGLLVAPLGAWAIVVAVLIELAGIFIFSELGPKNYAVRNPDRVALMVAPVITAVVRFPPVQLLSRLLIAIGSALLPGRINDGPVTSEQELLALADAALEEDVIERDERSMIHSVIEFGDTVAREVMVPRPDMTTVASTSTVEAAIDVAIAHGFSRIPVTGDSKDDIAGIVYVKDLMKALRDGRGQAKVASLARAARFAPEGKRVSELLREMQVSKSHIAVVLDEYGGTAGLVTLEDLLEELVGDISDEYDREEQQLERLPNGDVRVNAMMNIEDLNSVLDVEWPSEDWDSVGGLVFNELGHPASEGEQVEYEGFMLRAERVKGRRIGRVRISRMPDEVHDNAHLEA